jgi:hypothetical protein
MAIPPRFGTEFICDPLFPGTAYNDFTCAISTIDGIRKKVIPAANPKVRIILRSIAAK